MLCVFSSFLLCCFFSIFYVFLYFFFFFQAEDGIRDLTVTGVQTCALPIYFRCKTIDNASEVFSFGEGFASQSALDINKGEKGLSGNDRRHASSMNVLWDMPWFRKQNSWEGHLLGGWQVNGTYVLASGRAFTPSQ